MNTAPTLLCGRGALYLFTFKLRTPKYRRHAGMVLVNGHINQQQQQQQPAFCRSSV